ncbi:MAG TPA: pyridoxal phosphate-dependent aminotransferase family protein, partial [Thermoanaerobaculaceae bacterium]|nr:pyridoxal phosphate-dependent aminotransferase family protein [Thermoanaerobaculaceae bacterium]
MDIFQKCYEFHDADAIKQAGLYLYFRTISSAQDPVVLIDGHEVVMLGSNNYLGLTNHPEVKEAAREAISKYGTGCAGSRFLNGTLDIHIELEERLARFVNKPAAVTFSTGFQVNLGTISCLLERGDVVYLDKLDHACIIDGARLGFGTVVKFDHNDMADLGRRMAVRDSKKASMVVVDGVFSMEGDIVNLPDLVKVAAKHDARVMVDDAHGLGVLGAHGRGTAEHFGLQDKVDLIMGTFSKSLASVGGFIAGDERIINFIKHRARSLIFSAAPPPASVAAVIKAVEIIEREPERREQLWENTRFMKAGLQGLGFDTGDSASPI